jgi:hypothetical protein
MKAAWETERLSPCTGALNARWPAAAVRPSKGVASAPQRPRLDSSSETGMRLFGEILQMRSSLILTMKPAVLSLIGVVACLSAPTTAAPQQQADSDLLFSGERIRKALTRAPSLQVTLDQRRPVPVATFRVAVDQREFMLEGRRLNLAQGPDQGAQVHSGATVKSSMPLPLELRLRLYFLPSTLFQCSCTPRLPISLPLGL